MLGSHSSVVEELGGLEANRPGERRRRIVETLFEMIPCDFALYYTFVRHEGEDHYTAVTPVGDEELGDFAREMEGQPCQTAQFWEPSAPLPREINQFVRTNYEGERLVEEGTTRLGPRLVGGSNVGAQAHALLYDGQQLVGWIGMIRRREEPFGLGEIERLNRLVPTLRSSFQGAERMEVGMWDRPADILYGSESSTVEYASRGARDWLTRERREMLGEIVERAARQETLPATEVCEGLGVRVARLEGALGVRYAVTIERLQRPELGPKSLLTLRQREVAEYAVAGATAEEIAETLEISPNTVRDHIRNIYRRLGIGSRAELAGTFAEID